MATKVKVGVDRKVDQRANEAFLKRRVKELENEVNELKHRLDELRKAKNTTVFKREREILEVGMPFGRREPKGIDDNELAKKLLEKDKEWQKELDAIQKKYTAEMDLLRKNAPKTTNCGHLPQLEFLQQRNEELENDNAAMTAQIRELKERTDALISDLSIKEATWCEMEEKFKLELKRSWGEKYKEWMEQTEAKIAELQRANALLRTYLKNHHPTGPDPTGQDPDFDTS